MTWLLLGRIVFAVAIILHYIFYFYGIVVFISIIFSWIRPSPYNPTISAIVRVIYNLTEPVFQRVRKRLPQGLMRTGLDFSPIIVGLFLLLAEILIVGTLFDLSYRLRLGAI